MVRLDRVTEGSTALDPVGSDRTLDETVGAEPLSLGFEQANERGPDPTTFFLGVAHIGQCGEEPVGRRKYLKSKSGVPEELAHPFDLLFPEESGIDEQGTGPFPQGPFGQDRRDRAVDATGSGDDRFPR